MEKGFAALFLIAVGLVVVIGADRCNCPVKHPQQSFCEADFVFVATVRGAEEIGGYLAYDMKVSQEKVFKGSELIDRGQVHISVFTSHDAFFCGRPNLVYMKKYLISGTVNSENGNLEFSYCDWIEEWENISPEQTRFLKRDIYSRQCNTGCTVQEVYSAHEIDMNAMTNSFHEDQLSGMWSRHRCTYNPVASAMYVQNDCENKFAYCTQDVATGSCMWKANNNYDECFIMREATWAIRHPKEPAFTRVKQCRRLTTKRMKKKCMKAVRAHSRANGRKPVLERPIPQ